MQTDLKGMVRAADTTRLEPHAEPKGSRYLSQASSSRASGGGGGREHLVARHDHRFGARHIPIAAFTDWL